MLQPAIQPLNPYAPPVAPLDFAVAPPSHSGIPDGIWRQGKLLVMHKRAQLPPICVKSNQPSATWLKRKLSWHPPWIAITILAGLLIYIILALILTKRAAIHIGLSEEWAAKRTRRIIVCWASGLFFLALIAFGIALGLNTDNGIWLMLVPLGFIGALIVLIVSQPLVGLVAPQRITDEYVWLKGVNREFLARLPDFPYRV